jgi:D-psicose/D-tagatose/L-ribulose 3-epimerase
VVNTIEEALRTTGGHQRVQTMLDTHNTAGETLPVADLIRRHRASIRHVHLNEMDGRYPGSGNYDFAAVLRTLREIQYPGWLSVEVFDFLPDGETVAAKAKTHLESVARRITQ